LFCVTQNGLAPFYLFGNTRKCAYVIAKKYISAIMKAKGIYFEKGESAI
jgi:hypothetical protein